MFLVLHYFYIFNCSLSYVVIDIIVCANVANLCCSDLAFPVKIDHERLPRVCTEIDDKTRPISASGVFWIDLF